MSKEDNLPVPLWQRAKLEGYVSDAVLTDMKRENTLEKLQSTNAPIEAVLPNGSLSVRVALRRDGRYCGFVGLYDYRNPISLDDQKSLSLIAKALTVLIAEHPDFAVTEDTQWESLLFQLLRCQTQEQAEIAAKHSGLTPAAESMRLICLRPDAAASLPLSRLKELLYPCAASAVSVLYEEQIVLLLPLKGREADRLEALRAFCTQRRLRFGSSAPFAELSFAPVAYAQATACFHHAGECTRFEDALPQEIRRLCLAQRPAAYFLHPLFGKVRAYDREYRLNYLQTLLAYLDHHGNLRSTADELQIHYNTMKHRLDVIESISGVRLRDDDALQQILAVSKLFL